MTGVMALHKRLREETRTLHEDLEHAVAIDEQISSRTRYCAYLARLWALYSAAESALGSHDFSALGFNYGACRRSQLIESDLSDIGVDLVNLRNAIRPKAPALPTIEHALGCIYVLEGSALGARAMAPEVETKLGLTGTYGAKFFWGYGEEGKPIWRAVLASINAIDPVSSEAERVIQSAQATFLFFDAGFQSVQQL